ncbi:DUF2857 domain-containing protein, partial [Candidatus Symbiopectobacterium sp. NZEC135]
ISLGGSLKLINQYFGLSCHETCARRRLLGIRVAQGRTPHPNENVDIDIWLRWQKHRTENIESLHALDAMMLITEQLSCTDDAPSLTAVWHLITRYEKETLIRRNVYAG